MGTSDDEKEIKNPVTGSSYPVKSRVGNDNGEQIKGLWNKPPTIPMICTLVLPIKKQNWAKFVLLGMKNRGFGKGRYNGFGGKIEPGENIIDAAIRELEEECGLKATPESMKYMGTLHFISCDNSDCTVYVFTCNEYEGDPKSTEEMTVNWFDIKKIPLNKMWPDDRIWLPIVLDDEKEVSGYFSFKGEDEISHFSLSVGRLNDQEEV